MKKAMILAALLVVASTTAFADQTQNTAPAPAPKVGDACTMGNVTGHLVDFWGWLVCVAPPDSSGGGTGG